MGIAATRRADNSDPRVVRWGILGAANIARAQFMPGLRESGDGEAAIIASRDLERARTFADREGVGHAVDSYEAVLHDPRIDAVYIPLPNSEHGQWTIDALRAGKRVLCEKPLCAQVTETEEVIAAAREHPDSLLWEAFVFPFQAQHARLVELLAAGELGALKEVSSAFHFPVRSAQNIRLSAALGGGALADVGCYPIRLAQELLGPPDGPVALDARVEGEVEVDAAALVPHGDQRLTLTCGFKRAYDTFTRILCDGGWLHLTNPFHPQPSDTLEIHRPGQGTVVERPTHDAHSFTAALRHIHAVVRGDDEPRHLAIDSAVTTAHTLAALQQLLPASRDATPLGP